MKLPIIPSTSPTLHKLIISSCFLGSFYTTAALPLQTSHQESYFDLLASGSIKDKGPLDTSRQLTKRSLDPGWIAIIAIVGFLVLVLLAVCCCSCEGCGGGDGDGDGGMAGNIGAIVA